MQQPPYDPSLPRAAVQRQPTWLTRNLGAAISIGCLGAIMLVVLLFTTVFGGVTTAIRASDAYTEALAAASHNPALLAEIGAPLKPGFFVSGSLSVTSTAGRADLSIPISGSLRSGKVNAVATKAGGKWTFSKLIATVDGRPTRIDLRPSLAVPSPPK